MYSIIVALATVAATRMIDMLWMPVVFGKRPTYMVDFTYYSAGISSICKRFVLFSAYATTMQFQYVQYSKHYLSWNDQMTVEKEFYNTVLHMK